jgi:4-oxalocrotonate tautomerase family enzyme
MPVITIAIKKTSVAEKTALIEKLTAAAVEATKMPAEKFITYVQEYDDEAIGLGGKTLKEVMKAH